jgi:CBS domain containing-hemolysin-like protein
LKHRERVLRIFAPHPVFRRAFFLSFFGRFLKPFVITRTASLALFRQKQKEKETDPSKTTTIQTTTEKNAFRSSPFAV